MIATKIALSFLLASCAFAQPVIHEETWAKKKYHIGGGRRLQQTCSAENTAIGACASSACIQCLNDSFDAIMDAESVTCGFFESEMCKNIHSCSACSSCTEVVEDFYECVALNGGCSRFRCENPPTPEPVVTTTTTTTATQPIEVDTTCGMTQFNQYCQSALGSGAAAACVIMG